jgi:enediyne biosynthesis protein E4
MRHALQLLFLACLAAGGAATVRADIAFVDVARYRGLDFHTAAPTQSTGWPDVLPYVFELTLGQFGSGLAVGDYDRDGDLDVYVLGTLGQPNRLFRNDLDSGEAVFSDQTIAPLDDLGLARAAQFVDLDGDGWLDLVLLNEEDPFGISHSRIFRNVQGSFVDVTEGSGFVVRGYMHGGLGFADVDGDGRVDIFVSAWGKSEIDPALSNHFFRNLGEFRFEDVTEDASLNLTTDDVRWYSAVFVRFEPAEYPDLVAAIDHGVEKLLRILEGLVYDDVGPSLGFDHFGNGMGLAVGDVDGDLDLDVYVTKIHDPTGLFGSGFGNALYRNMLSETGSLAFDEVAAEARVVDSGWGWGAELFDADNDGDLDLAAVTGFDVLIEWYAGQLHPLFATPGKLWMNDGGGNFTEVVGTALDCTDDSRALVAFDFDRDGDLDLLIANQDGPVRLLENRTLNGNNAFDIVLAPDSLGITASVFLTADGRTMRSDLLYGRSFYSGAPNEVHFGLGKATMVDEVRVQWADGVATEHGPFPAGQVLELRRCVVGEMCSDDVPCETGICPPRTVWLHQEAPEVPPIPHRSEDGGAQDSDADMNADGGGAQDGGEADASVRPAPTQASTCSSAGAGARNAIWLNTLALMACVLLLICRRCFGVRRPPNR